MLRLGRTSASTIPTGCRFNGLSATELSLVALGLVASANEFGAGLQYTDVGILGISYTAYATRGGRKLLVSFC